MHAPIYDFCELDRRQVTLPFVPATEYHVAVVTDEVAEFIVSFDARLITERDDLFDYEGADLSRLHLNGLEVTERELEDRYPSLPARLERWATSELSEARRGFQFELALSEVLDN
jgi:hypothetical protein